MVAIDHGNGMHTWYAHLSRFEVVPGRKYGAAKCWVIGASGKVTALHLHFEVRLAVPGEPISYLMRS
jgi:murein DD-endopeptidase MepM/ murein hydrolase activator NlpD